MSKFTVEEINFMCVFETQDRMDMIGQIRQVMPHIKDSDMEELGEQVLGKLQNMTDAFLLHCAPNIPEGNTTSPFLINPTFFASSQITGIPICILSISYSFGIHTLLILLPLIQCCAISISPIHFT